MKLLTGFLVAAIAVVVGGTSHGAFVSGGSNYIAKEIGTFTQQVVVNEFLGDGRLATSSTLGVVSGVLSGTSAASYTDSLGTKTFKMVLIAPTASTFSFSTTGSVLGVVASTGWMGSAGSAYVNPADPIYNVWANYSNLMPQINTVLGVAPTISPLNNAFFNANFGAPGDAGRGFEIHAGLAGGGNPDSMTRIGNSFSGSVNSPGSGSGRGELFAVLFEVPEPATMALWGMGAVGLAAFRFRRRK